MSQPSPQEVVDFWFGAPGSPDWLKPRDQWFAKDPAFDQAIGSRFGGLLQRALDRTLDEDGWREDSTPTRLARILVCDQFPRNAWRDSPRAFALDPIALATSETLIGSDEERALPAVQRIFVYMPLMHSESAADQARCVVLFQALAAESPVAQVSFDFAVKHQAVIERFGRFPHRNRILGRPSTPEELAFLKEPGSSF